MLETKTVWKHIINTSYYKPYLNYNGMTVACVKDPITPGNVLVSVAMCSKKEAYSRKAGREVCLGKIPDSVPLKKLPVYLANYEARLFKYGHLDFHDYINKWKAFAFKFI